MVLLGATLLATLVLLGTLLGDQLVPSLATLDLWLITGGIVAVITIEITWGTWLVASRGTWIAGLERYKRERHGWRDVDRAGTAIKTCFHERLARVGERHPAIPIAWAGAWGTLHLLIAIAAVAGSTWLGISYVPIMEPRYLAFIPVILLLAATLFIMYTRSAIRAFKAIHLHQSPRLARGTMVPIAIAAIVMLSILAYPVPGYYLEKWRLDAENAALGVIYDEYGGWANPPAGSGLDTLAATGWFRVEKVGGRFWLVDPAGKPFISKGVNYISYNSDAIKGTSTHPYGLANDARYGSQEAWANATLLRMGAWNFNTAGAWCDWFNIYLAPYHRKPYTFNLGLADEAGADWLSGGVADMWGDTFVNGTPSVVESRVFYFKNDPYCIGYFLDNELNWGSKDWRSDKTLLELYLDMPVNATGRGVLLDFLAARCDHDVARFNEAFGTRVSSWVDVAGLGKHDVSFETSLSREIAEAFRHEVALQYFTVCHDAIRAKAPNQLILGCRFATDPLESVTSAAKGMVDAISFAGYSTRPPIDRFERVFLNNDVPVIIEEFAIKAADSGLPNTRGAGPVVPTQQLRALLVAQYIRDFMARPYAIGYHWFQWADQPAEGRFDGENSNFGLVKINDDPWTLLVDMMASSNLRAETIHAGL